MPVTPQARAQPLETVADPFWLDCHAQRWRIHAAWDVQPSVYEPFGGSAGAAEETSAAASERELRFRAGATPEPGGGSRRVQSAAASPR